MCGCGCDIVADLVRAEAEARALAEVTSPPACTTPAQLDRRQGWLARTGAWLLATRTRGTATLELTRASRDDRIEAV
jgi:hypothetical protein